MTKRDLRFLIILAICAAAGKLILAWNTRGTNDIWSFWQFQQKSSAIGVLELYRTDPLFNHPPFVVSLLRLWAWLQWETGVPFGFWLRFLQIAADVGSLFLVVLISRHSLGERLSYAGLWAMAVAPASIMISAFHGNNDPLMMCLLLAAVYWAGVKQNYWIAGALYGLSCNIKAWPVVLAPVFFFYMKKNWRARFSFFALAGAVTFAVSLPYIWEDSDIILERVLGYRSSPGLWGLTRLGGFREDWWQHELEYIENGKFLILFLTLVASVIMNSRPKPPPLHLQAGFGAFLFMAFSPGFGVQYLAWLVPWVTWTSIWYLVPFHVATGVFLFRIYTFWSNGFPWDLATAKNWPWPIVQWELLCWMLVLLYLPLAAYGFSRSARDPALTGVDAYPSTGSPRERNIH